MQIGGAPCVGTAFQVALHLRVLDDLADPGPGQVRVAIAASGVCHTDASVQHGTIPNDVPVVLGHEGAGVVRAVGPGVTGVAAGDHVVLSAINPETIATRLVPESESPR